MSDVPEFLKNSKPSRTEIMLKSPLANFIFGCIWFGIGISYWQTQILTNLLIENNFSPLIGLFITGTHLLFGYILISSHYDVIIEMIRKKRYIGNVDHE